MPPAARKNESLSGSTPMLNQNRSEGITTAHDSPAQAFPGMSTEQRVEIIPASSAVCREPEIIYLKLPIINPAGNDPVYSMKSFARLPDDWQESKEENKPAKIPIATKSIAEDTARQRIVSEHPTKRTSSTETANDQDAVTLDGNVTKGEYVSGNSATVKSNSADVTTNKDITDCNTVINAESTVTASAVACGGVTFNVTVSTNRKLTLTQKKFPNENPPRYVVHAPVDIKIILQKPMSSNTDVIESHSAK